MATAKQFELLFQLTARLGPNFSQSFKNASQTMKLLQNDLRSADQKLKDVSAYQKQQNAVEKSRQRVSELQAEHERLTREIEEAGQATPELTRQLQANERALQKAQDATAREEERLGELSNTLREAGVNTDNLGRDTNELRQQYERLEQAQRKVQEITEKQAANKEAISQTKAQLGGLVGTVTAVGAAIYAGPVKKAAEFQEQMSTVKSISNASAEDMAKLSQKAKEMGATTAFTAAEAGEAMEYMAMAGWKTGDMLGGIEGIMNLAAASGEELGSVSDIVTDALTAFGLSASDAGHFSDVLAQASSNANTNVSMMGSTFQKVAPVAGALGYSVEDMSLGIGLMANASIKAEVAGTSLKTALANMAKPTKQQAAYMDKYGISLTKTDGTMKTFGEVVENLRGSLGGLSEQEQIAAATAIFGKESFAGMLAIVNASEQDYNKLTEAVYNCDGAAKRMAETKLDNLNGSITLAKSAFDALQVELGELLLPTLTEGVKKFTDIITVVTTFVRENPGAVKAIAKIVAGLVGLKAGGLIAKLGFLEVKGGILSIQKAFTMIKGLGITKYLSSMGGGFGGILTKILPLVGVIAAVGGAIYYVSTHLEQVRGFIQKTFGNEGLAVFNKLWSVITQVGTAIKDAFFTSGTGVLDTLKSIIPTVINTLKTGLLPILPMLANMVIQILPLIGQLVTAILPVLGELIGAVITVLATLIAEILPVIVQLISALLPLVLQVVQSVLPVLIQLINAVVPLLIQIVQAVLPVIIQLIQTIVPLLTQIIQAVLPVLIQLVNAIVPILIQIIQSVLPVLIQLVNAILPILTQIIQAVLPVIIQLIQTILPLVMQIVDTILPIFINLLNTLLPIFMEIIQSILPVIIQLIQTVLPIVQQIIDTVLPIFISLLNTLVPIFQNIIQAILPVLTTLLQALIPVIELVANIFSSVLGSALQSIAAIVQNVMQIFQGLIDFITGVFTGNWSQAWNGIKSIFSGAVGGLGEIIKAPLRAVVSAVNTVIGGLNKLSVPDWVPGIGGKGINIPLIPGFVNGTVRTPDTFIAGENGPELITGAANRSVFTAAQTGQIFNNMAQAQNLNTTASNVNAGAIGAGTITIHVTNNPTVNVKGGETDGIKEQLQQYDEEFLEKIRQIIITILREQKEQEGRVAYA
ncbi:phage tail tape measure protein [bacterium D16-51]|nr:phage tail tape measure protein [bacterium D16-59]RKI59478.1 phage tail tape measure protein [bacterium D16-51]